MCGSAVEARDPCDRSIHLLTAVSLGCECRTFPRLRSRLIDQRIAVVIRGDLRRSMIRDCISD